MSVVTFYDVEVHLFFIKVRTGFDIDAALQRRKCQPRYP